MRKLWKLMVHGVWIGSWVLVIVADLSLGDDSPHSTYDETGNEVTSSRLVLAPDRPECAKATTLTFCLDDARYPSDDIQREISTNYGVFYKMYAEVSNQTTSSLVDGVTVDEEATYDYAFYYGDKMNLPTKSAARNSPAYKNYAYKNDYFKDGGYICPAFINYGSIYQAMNARGEWQYIVNLKPWTQTVRLEQCFYPHAPCSYMSTSFETRCVQKYSFQRLIAFEPQGRGLYTDIFRLPTACSCYIRPPEPQNALPALLQGDASQSLAYVDSTSSNAVVNGFKPIRVRNPPPNGPQSSRADYGQAASASSFNRGPSNWSPSQRGPPGKTWSADVGTPVSHANDQDSRLVERRRVRPEGLSLSDMTSDPDVGPSAFGYMDNGPPRGGPPRDRAGMYQPGRWRFGSPPPGRGPMYQGDGSQMNPTPYSDGPRGPYYQGPGPDNGPAGAAGPPPMQRDGPGQDGMWNGPPSQGPANPQNQNGQGSASAITPLQFGVQTSAGSHPDFQMRQSSGFYDYNSAHGEMNGPS